MKKAQLKRQFLKDDGDWGDCWLCLRTDPHSVLEATHKLIDDPHLAHKIGMNAAKLLRDAYLKNPTALCGRKTSALIGAAIYIACRLEGLWYYTQRDIIHILGNTFTDPTFTRNYHHLAQVMDIEVPPKYPMSGRKEA